MEPQLISYQDLGTRLAPSATKVLVWRKHLGRQNQSTRDIPLEGAPRQIFSGPGSIKFAVPNFKIKTVRTDSYGRKSNRKVIEKINKENKNKMVNYICPIFRFATQIFNGPPLVKYRIYTTQI